MKSITTQNLQLVLGFIGILALFLSLWALYSLRKLNSLKETFFQGSEGVSLEGALRTLDSHLLDLQNQHLLLEKNFLNLKEEFALSIQKIGMIKFNPFENAGGSLSFCIALLDQNNSGLVITSMHARDHNRIYAKKIINGKSELQLTEEETEAVQAANDPESRLSIKTHR